MTKEILLENIGLTTLVGDEDYEYLIQWEWRANPVSSKYPEKFYACRNDEDGTMIWMHRIINQTPKGMKTDHIDGNTLNNVRSNLRSATHSQNLQNQSKQKHNTSGYKGVVRSLGKWVSKIAVDGKRIYLGTFDTSEDAAHAYDSAAKEYFGEFARTNF